MPELNNFIMSYHISTKNQKLGKYWSFDTRNRAVFNAYNSMVQDKGVSMIKYAACTK